MCNEVVVVVVGLIRLLTSKWKYRRNMNHLDPLLKCHLAKNTKLYKPTVTSTLTHTEPSWHLTLRVTIWLNWYHWKMLLEAANCELDTGWSLQKLHIVRDIQFQQFSCQCMLTNVLQIERENALSWFIIGYIGTEKKFLEKKFLFTRAAMLILIVKRQKSLESSWSNKNEDQFLRYFYLA